MSNVVKRATRSLSFRTQRNKKNEQDKLARHATETDSSDDDPKSTRPSSPSPSSARGSPSASPKMIPSPSSCPGGVTAAVDGTSLRSNLEQDSRERINSVTLSPREAARRAAALEATTGGERSKDRKNEEKEREERRRRESEADLEKRSGEEEEGEGSRGSKHKGRSRASSTPAPRPTVVPTLSLAPAADVRVNDGPSSARSPSPSPKALASSKSASAIGGSKGGKTVKKLKQSKSARYPPKPAQSEGGWNAFSQARRTTSISSSELESDNGTPSNTSSLSSSLSSRRDRENKPLELVVREGSQWVRKHHITPEEARDHNTLVALMPYSMRKNIPMGDILTNGPDDGWHIGDDDEKTDNGEAEKKGRDADARSTNSDGNGETAAERLKRPDMAALAFPTPRDRTTLVRTASKESPDKEKSGFLKKGSFIAAIASPRTWLNKKDEGGSPTNGSPKETRRNWFDRKDKEDSDDGGTKKEEKRSRSFRRMRIKKSEDAIVQPSPGSKNEAEPLPRSESGNAVESPKRGATASDLAAEEVDEPSEGEDEEDIRGEYDITTSDAIKEVQEPHVEGSSAKDNVLADSQVNNGENSEGKSNSAPSTEGGDGKTKTNTITNTMVTSEARRPSVLAKSMKMAMEEELLSRVQERAPTSLSGTSVAVGSDGEGDEEEDELFFSEANEAVIIQLAPQVE